MKQNLWLSFACNCVIFFIAGPAELSLRSTPKSFDETVTQQPRTKIKNGGSSQKYLWLQFVKFIKSKKRTKREKEMGSGEERSTESRKKGKESRKECREEREEKEAKTG